MTDVHANNNKALSFSSTCVMEECTELPRSMKNESSKAPSCRRFEGIYWFNKLESIDGAHGFEAQSRENMTI